MTKMTNAEAVERINKLKTKYAEQVESDKKCDYAINLKPMLDDISAFDLAIAALSLEPLDKEFPSWAEFQKLGFKEVTIQRNKYIFEVAKWCDKKNNDTVAYWIYDDKKNTLLVGQFPYTESGYLAAISQLNAWLEELINELRGVK